MFKDVKAVVRRDARSLALKHKRGKDTVFQKKIIRLTIVGRAVTVKDGFSYESDVSLADGQYPIPEYYDDPIINHEGPLVFTITNSRPYPLITADASLESDLYHLYYFHEERFGGEINQKRVQIRPSSEAEEYYVDVTVHSGKIWIVLSLPHPEFERLFQAIWFASTPCRLQLQIQLVCFEEIYELFSFHRGILLDADKPIPVRLQSVDVERSTLAPLFAPQIDVDLDDRQSRFIIQRIEKLLQWVLPLIAAIAMVLILRR